MKILFIGAGASKGARQNHEVTPPLGPELLQFLRKHTQRFKESATRTKLICHVHTLEEVHKVLALNPGITNFENFLPSLDRDQRELIHFAVQIFFSDLSVYGHPENLGFANRPDEYDRLIQKLEISGPEWIVISLNYDVLFEEALRRARIEFYYPLFSFELGVTPDPKLLAVYKPHGSINFLGQADNQVGYNALPELGRPTGFKTNSSGETCPHYPIVYATPGGAENVVTYAHEGALVSPIMANYTQGKESDTNDGTLGEVRKACLSQCKSDSEILIIGVNPILNSADDPFCSALLSLAFKRVRYVGKDSAAGKSIKQIFNNADLYLNGLSKFLDKET